MAAPARTVGEILNPLPKYVASRTLRGTLDWNATVVEGDATESVARLKDDLDGDLAMSGCGELARTLLVHGLIDEIRFWVHPAVGGARTRPFYGEPASATRRVDSVRLGRRAAAVRTRDGEGSTDADVDAIGGLLHALIGDAARWWSVKSFFGRLCDGPLGRWRYDPQ